MMEVLEDEMVVMDEMIVFEEEEFASGGDNIGSGEILEQSKPARS